MIFEHLEGELERFPARKYKRNEIIYHEGDSARSLFVIESGIIGLFHISESGHETLLRVFSKNYVFGHRSMIAKEPYHASAICLTPVSVREIPSSKLKEICLKKPDLIFDMAKVLAKELRASELRLSGLQDKSANRRIIEALVFLKLKHPDYTWTRKEIADFAGSTLESVVRVITIMEKEGLLEKSGRDFHIRDYESALEFSRSI